MDFEYYWRYYASPVGEIDDTTHALVYAIKEVTGRKILETQTEYEMLSDFSSKFILDDKKSLESIKKCAAKLELTEEQLERIFAIAFKDFGGGNYTFAKFIKDIDMYFA